MVISRIESDSETLTRLFMTSPVSPTLLLLLLFFGLNESGLRMRGHFQRCFSNPKVAAWCDPIKTKDAEVMGRTTKQVNYCRVREHPIHRLLDL